MLGRIVVAWLFLPKYFKGQMLTAYQLIDQRFGPALHKLTAGLFLLTRAAAEGVRVFAISIVVGIAIGTGDILSIAIISALTLLYTFEGGMAAVIWTDVLQMGLYIVGTLAAIWSLGLHVPGGWSHIHAVAAPLGKFHWLNFTLNLTTAYTFWAGVLGGTFLTMASHGTDQLMVQRMLAARNLRESRLALLSSGVVIFIQFTLFLLIGVGLYVFYSTYPHTFPSSDRIFPTFIVQQMPRGVAGLLVAAILAAAMSNLSAALNSLASTTVIDFIVPLRKRDGDTAKLSRAATVFWAIVLFAIAVYAIQLGGKGHVVETGLSIASVAYGCLLGVFLLGTLTKYATQTGAILGMISGLALNLFLWLTPANSGWTYTTPTATHYIAVPHIAFTWYVLIGAAATFAIGTLFSLLLPKPRRALVILLLITAPLCLSFRSEAQESAVQPQYDFTPASTLITDAIATHKLPGAVLLIGHNGKVVFEHAYGNRKLAGEPGPLGLESAGKPSPAEPMTEDTIFDMASLTKVVVTTTAILQLYEQHKLDLDTPVAHYLPEFAQNGKDKITIRQLLTHYSGLPEDVDLKAPWGLAAPDKAEGIRRAMAATPYGPPGQTFKYSDINFITLGFLVEKLSVQPLDEYASSHIFRPLGMKSSLFMPFAKTCGPVIQLGSAVSLTPTPPPVRSADGRHISSLVGDYGCGPGGWDVYRITYTAPTAHDNEGTLATNPNYDHLLRGTVHDPTTRRMGGVAGHAGLFSTAHDMSIFCQALLDKLTKNTGPFPLKQSTLQLATSPQAPATAHADATIFLPDGTPTKGVAQRGLGWDLNSPFSRPRGTIFPITTAGHPGSFGHTGFTGTSLWLDPTSNTYVILLANAIHPRGNATISPLRGQVATAVARALNNTAAVSSDTQTVTGIDVLEQTNFEALTTLSAKLGHPVRLGIVTNQSGLDANGNRSIDILARPNPAFTLKTIFTPEHGLRAAQDTEHLKAEQDDATHLPVISLYGAKRSDRHAKQSDLKALDALLIDLPDAGARFWTYETLTGYLLEDCAHAHVPLYILDRPNPLGGLAVQGPTADPGTESYFNFSPIPIRHGLTLGELARYFNANATEVSLDPALLDARTVEIGATGPDKALPPATQPGLHANLTVIPMQHWKRSQFFAETGLAWIPPSPNLRTPATNIVYPGVALLEYTSVSVGRGTAAPYENIGAPWIKADELAAYLNARNIPGIKVSATTLQIAETPEHYPFHGQTVAGVRFTVLNAAALDSPELGIELLAAFSKLYPMEFHLEKAKALLLSAATLDALRKGTDAREIAAAWAGTIADFERRRAPFLLYP